MCDTAEHHGMLNQMRFFDSQDFRPPYNLYHFIGYQIFCARLCARGCLDVPRMAIYAIQMGFEKDSTLLMWPFERALVTRAAIEWIIASPMELFSYCLGVHCVFPEYSILRKAGTLCEDQIGQGFIPLNPQLAMERFRHKSNSPVYAASRWTYWREKVEEVVVSQSSYVSLERARLAGYLMDKAGTTWEEFSIKAKMALQLFQVAGQDPGVWSYPAVSEFATYFWSKADNIEIEGIDACGFPLNIAFCFIYRSLT
jgi:hypothetical protein